MKTQSINKKSKYVTTGMKLHAGYLNSNSKISGWSNKPTPEQILKKLKIKNA